MKREAGLLKLEGVCNRLDEMIADPIKFLYLRPIKVWVIGSILTTKDIPSDIDLISYFDTNVTESLVHPAMQYTRMIYRHNFIEDAAVIRSFKQFRSVHMIRHYSESINDWFSQSGNPETPSRLLWERGLNWHSVITNMRDYPLPYDADLENKHDEINRIGFKRVKKVYDHVVHQKQKDKGTPFDNLESPIFYPISSGQGGVIIFVSKNNCPPEFLSLIEVSDVIRFNKLAKIVEFEWHFTDTKDIDLIKAKITLRSVNEKEIQFIKSWAEVLLKNLFDTCHQEMLPIVWRDRRNPSAFIFE